MQKTWSELVARAKQNDQGAFYDLYQNSYDAVYRTVKSMVRDEDAALDITQDAFVRGFANLSTLENPEQFLAWMKRIATNTAKNWFKKKREMTFSQMADEDGNQPDFEDERTENLPEAVLDRNETARLIKEILDSLPDEQRLVIGMFYYQNMTASEIAAELEISENTVKSRLIYGKKKIRASVEELEKKGTKLYSLSPIPFLLLLFRNQMLRPSVGNAPAATFGNIMASASGTALPAAAGTAAGATATATSAGGGVLAGIGAKIASGFLALLIGGGIAAGVLAATLVGGGIKAAMDQANRVGNDEPSVSESGSAGEGDSELTAEERLTRYLEEELIPEKGIYNIEQTSYQSGITSLIRTDTTFDPATGECKQESMDIMHDEVLYAEYEAAKEHTDVSGLYNGDFYDYDGDGEPELLAVYGEANEVWLELFDVQENKVVSVGKLSLRTLELKHPGPRIGRASDAKGEVYLVIIDYAPHSAVYFYDTYYRISNRLKPVSYLQFHSNEWNEEIQKPVYKTTEYFYDSGTEHTTDHVLDMGWGEDYDASIADYGGDKDELLCKLYEVGMELNDFLRNYYKGGSHPANRP